MGIWSWLMGAFGGCKHEWLYDKDYRVCLKCPRAEKFTPDAGGWTAGHWDEVK